MLLNNDGAPFKAFGAMSHNTIFRNNIAFNTTGNTEGTANGQFATPGLYFDNYVYNDAFIDNTVYNCPAEGMFVNSESHDNKFTGNVIYGAAQS